MKARTGRERRMIWGWPGGKQVATQGLVRLIGAGQPVSPWAAEGAVESVIVVR